MKVNRQLTNVLMILISTAALGWTGLSLAAPPAAGMGIPLPPVHVIDNTLTNENWALTAEATAGATYSVTQRLEGGFAGGPFRFMSHRLPPVSGSDLASLKVNHLYLSESYTPSVEGPIVAIDYQEADIILSFPFPEAFSTTQPLIEQDGRLYRSAKFIRFIAQNSSHNWQITGLFQLTAADFLAVDGSGDQPDFSASGGPLRFGFTRLNSRSSTLPPVPGSQELVIDQGVDAWHITIYRNAPPPQAVDDVVVLDGYRRSLPVQEFLSVTRNDLGNTLNVITTTQPLYGSTAVLVDLIIYQLDEARVFDTFSYTISDGELTSSAGVEIHFDCACSILCLNDLAPSGQRYLLQAAAEDIDLPLIYRVRETILKPTAQGRRYVDMYYQSNPEILLNLLANETLREEALAVVALWQDNLRSLTAGDGSALITQAQVEAVSGFLDHLASASSARLQQVISDERQRIGPLDKYVGLTVKEARRQAVGEPVLYLPWIAAP